MLKIRILEDRYKYGLIEEEFDADGINHSNR
jgi:hypothetical protein